MAAEACCGSNMGPPQAERKAAKRRRKSTRSVPSRQGHRRKAKTGFNWIVRNCLLCALIRGLQNLEASFIKGFNCCGAKLRLRCANSRFAEPRSFLKKVLIVAVRSYSYSVLIQGLRNLETSCEGIRVVTFCIVQKVTKKHAGLRPATHDSKLCRK